MMHATFSLAAPVAMLRPAREVGASDPHRRRLVADDRSLPTNAARDDVPPPPRRADAAPVREARAAMPGRGDAESRADALLMARVAAGDADALGLLYDRHGDAAHALALGMVGVAGDAEDVVAGVFDRVWRTAASFDAARGSVGAWITTMTRSRALDLLRARKRRARLLERAAADDDDGLALPLAQPAVAPDEALEREEIGHAVRASLASLPDAQRRVIELAYWGGLSHSAIAEALQEPLGTVKTRLRAGLQKLRQAMTVRFPEVAP